MRDLDMSNYEADGAAAYQDELDQCFNAYDQMSTELLEHLRYLLGITARRTASTPSVTHMRMIDTILLTRVTSLCEGCLGRGGCDMCVPPDWDYFYGSNDQNDHYERFGRPALPNEF